MTQLQSINVETGNTTLESGRSLALNLTQVNGLKENFKSKIVPSTPANIINEQPVQELIQNDVISSSNDSNIGIEAPNSANIEPPTISEPPVMNNANTVVPEINIVPNEVSAPPIPVENPSQEIIETPAEEKNENMPVIDLGIPFDQGNQEQTTTTSDSSNSIPNIDITPPVEVQAVNQPVISTEPQIEIVSSNNNRKTEYDALAEEIAKINEEFDNKIIELNTQRKNAIDNALTRSKEHLLEIQDKATEHLKNAQAAEQIANIAYEKAQTLQAA